MIREPLASIVLTSYNSQEDEHEAGSYLEKPEMEALLNAPAQSTPQGRRTISCCCSSMTPGPEPMRPQR